MKAYLLTPPDGQVLAPVFKLFAQVGTTLHAPPERGPDRGFWVALDPASAIAAADKLDSFTLQPYWPLRLFELEIEDRRTLRRGSPSDARLVRMKRFDVKAEIPAWKICGRYGEQVFDFISKLRALAPEQWRRIADAPLTPVRFGDPLMVDFELRRQVMLAVGGATADRTALMGNAEFMVRENVWNKALVEAGGLATNLPAPQPAAAPTAANWTQLRMGDAVNAAICLSAPDLVPAELFTEILRPYVSVMGDEWFRSAGDVINNRRARARALHRSAPAPPPAISLAPPPASPSPSSLSPSTQEPTWPTIC